jgi:hypothetical protein
MNCLAEGSVLAEGLAPAPGADDTHIEITKQRKSGNFRCFVLKEEINEKSEIPVLHSRHILSADFQ